MKIITRAEAKKLGQPTYFTGIPCRHGKKAERRVSNGICLCSKCKKTRADWRKSYYAEQKQGGEA